MMFVMVDFHRLGVDVWFERVERVRQRGHCKCHGLSSNFRFVQTCCYGACLQKTDTEDATALPVPNIPALTMPPLTKVRRFIECSCGAGVGASDAMDYNAIS